MSDLFKGLKCNSFGFSIHSLEDGFDVEDYLEVEKMMKKLKKIEMDMRKTIIAYVFDKGKPLSDNKNKVVATFKNGSRIEVIKRKKFKIEDEEYLEEVYDDLSEEEKQCFKKVFKLVESKYKKLSEEKWEEDLEIFDIIVEDDALPGLKILL